MNRSLLAKEEYLVITTTTTLFVPGLINRVAKSLGFDVVDTRGGSLFVFRELG